MGLLMSHMVKATIMTSTKKKTMDIIMTKEHLGASIQQHLRAFGYFQEDDEFFNLDTVKVRDDGNVVVTGRVE